MIVIMSKTTKEIGDQGERLAANFLKGLGMKVIAKNYRYKRTEIDLIAKEQDILVFIEVKLRSGHEFGFPEEVVNKRKMNRIFEGAENYQLENNWSGNIRFDIVAVEVRDKKVNIEHFVDAF